MKYISIPVSNQNKEAPQIINNTTGGEKMDGELRANNNFGSLAIFTAGIAHDFNNFLAIILGNLSLIKRHGEQNGIAEKIYNIEEAVEQAGELIQQLLIYFRGEEPLKKAICLKNLLSKIIKFTLKNPTLTFECDFPEEQLIVEVDEFQVSQVFHNLILNAVQAMPGGGTIKIIAKNVEVSEEKKEYLHLKKGSYRRVSVVDEGIGIPQTHLQNIFNPFFTTKIQGTGLGLAIVYSIIQKYEGFIEVETKLNEGTTFKVYLPAPF